MFRSGGRGLVYFSKRVLILPWDGNGLPHGGHIHKLPLAVERTLSARKFTMAVLARDEKMSVAQ